MGSALISRSVPTQEGLVAVRWEERPMAAVLHLLGWIPVWGFVVAALFWLFYRQRSRQLVFHVQQVVQLQILVLLPLLAWCVATIFARVLGLISVTAATGLQWALDFGASSALTVAAALAIWGAVEVYRGRPFLYPFFGRRVLEASIRKLTEA
jgi:uncharacterized Tic20 family protein